MFLYHPIRRARRSVQPRSYRKVRYPVRSALWTASGVGRKRPPQRRRRSHVESEGPVTWTGWVGMTVLCILVAPMWIAIIHMVI
jgi:hypothetical protein